MCWRMICFDLVSFPRQMRHHVILQILPEPIKNISKHFSVIVDFRTISQHSPFCHNVFSPQYMVKLAIGNPSVTHQSPRVSGSLHFRFRHSNINGGHQSYQKMQSGIISSFVGEFQGQLYLLAYFCLSEIGYFSAWMSNIRTYCIVGYFCCCYFLVYNTIQIMIRRFLYLLYIRLYPCLLSVTNLVPYTAQMNTISTPTPNPFANNILRS